MSESPYIETEEVAGKTLVKGSKLRPVDGLWPIERVAIPELAMLFWEKVNPGRYPGRVSWEERERYIKAMEHVLEALVAEDNARLYP